MALLTWYIHGFTYLVYPWLHLPVLVFYLFPIHMKNDCLKTSTITRWRINNIKILNGKSDRSPPNHVPLNKRVRIYNMYVRDK